MTAKKYCQKKCLKTSLPVKLWLTGWQLCEGDEEREPHPVSLMAMQHALYQAWCNPFWPSRPYTWLFGFLGTIRRVPQQGKTTHGSCAWFKSKNKLNMILIHEVETAEIKSMAWSVLQCDTSMCWRILLMLHSHELNNSLFQTVWKYQYHSLASWGFQTINCTKNLTIQPFCHRDFSQENTNHPGEDWHSTIRWCSENPCAVLVCSSKLEILVPYFK